MADVVHKTTLQYRRSVNTPDFPATEWLINPDLSALVGVAHKYWKVVGETVVEMTAAEKAVVDAPADVPAALTSAMDKIEAVAVLDKAEASALKAALGLPA